MELKPGYKHTEVGLLPEDWGVRTLADICRFENGDRSSNYPSPGSFVGSGVPFINAGHISDGVIHVDELDYITHDTFQRLSGGKVITGDILFCLRGSLGKFGVVPDEFGNGAIASSLIIIRPKKEFATREFISSYLASDMCRKMIDLWSGGAAQPNLAAKDLARFSVALPSTIEEQSAIATTLRDVDSLLYAQDALIDKKRALKQGAMQELLTGKRKLPGFGGVWKMKRLSELCSLKSGDAITATRIDGSSTFPCYGGNGLRGFTQSFTHEGDYALIGRQGALCGNVVSVNGKFFASEHALVVTPKSSTDIHWISLVLRRANLNQYSESSAQPGLSALKLSSLEFFVPPTKEEQSTIAEVLDDMDTEIVALEAKREKIALLKQGMMQELLTGKIRLV